MPHLLKAMNMRKAIIVIAVLNALWGSLALIASEELSLDHHATSGQEAEAAHAHHEASHEEPDANNCSIEHCPFCYISIVAGPLSEFAETTAFAPVQAAQQGCSLKEYHRPAFFALTHGPRPPPSAFI